jgi:hypothetical protein
LPAVVLAVPLANGRAAISWVLPTLEKSYVVRTREGSRTVGTRTAVGLDAIASDLTPGHSYSFELAAADGDAALGVSNVITALGSLAPNPVTSLTASADGSKNRATLQWQPPTTGPAPERYEIGVFENGKQVGAFTCNAPCTSQILNVTPGATVAFHVSTANAVGRSPVMVSNSVKVASSCPVACLSVDATSPGKTATRRAGGFLHAIGPRTDPGLISALRPTQWRVSLAWNRPNEAAYAAPHAQELTEILSDDWAAATDLGFGAALPWADWSRYSNFITSTVQSIKASGTPITYWEIQNEPGGPGYYRLGAAPTSDQLLTQFKVGYHAVKAADPNAKVVAPSLITWLDSPGSSRELDMRTFLDFAVLNDLRFDALSFHDSNYYRTPGKYARDWWGMHPDEVGQSVERLRELLAERPSLGRPAILVNEYGDPSTFRLPGWDAGRIGALEAAAVDGAQRTCWGNCADGYLDGLLAGDGRTTMPTYWVYAFYGAMSGRVLPVTTTNSGVTGLATIDSDNTIRILIGRHEGCAPQLQAADCPHQPVLGKADLRVDVRIPFVGPATLGIARIPAVIGSLAGPVAESSSPLVATAGTVPVTLPAVGDGEALEITITPA